MTVGLNSNNDFIIYLLVCWYNWYELVCLVVWKVYNMENKVNDSLLTLRSVNKKTRVNKKNKKRIWKIDKNNLQGKFIITLEQMFTECPS